METRTKDLILLQDIVHLIYQCNKQDDTPDYLFLTFRKKETGVSLQELNRILYVFCGAVNCPLHEITGKSRKQPLPDLRAMLCFYLREQGLTYIHIAEIIGWNDHSTALAAILKHKKLYQYDKQYKKIYDNFTFKIREDDGNTTFNP